VGPDGCGKSTVIHALKRRAQDVPTLRVDTTYLGPWGQMHLPWVPALRRAGITPVTRAFGRHVAGRSGPYLSPLVKGCLFYAATYVELMYRYLTTVFFSVRDGHWVIADRYVTDLRYMYKERPVSNYPRIRRLICRLFPKPDLLIVLDNQPAVITARKGGLTEPQIEVLRRSCLEAAKDYRYEVVTTDRPPDETADYILNRMLALDAPG
jgi:thymidylate kinase